MLCPKCKKENDDNAIVCNECGFKLKLKCPYCGNYNNVVAKTCASCGKQILKNCPECNAINFAVAKVCRKCSAPFPDSQSNTNSDDRVVSLAVELINIPSIKNNIKNTVIVDKVIKKFYQIFAKISKDAQMKPFKINENTLVVSFEHCPSFVDGVNFAIDFSGKLDAAISEVSALLEPKLKVGYKTRYLISLFKPQQKKDILSVISLGVVDDVIFSKEIYEILKDKLVFKEIVSSDGTAFYKFINPDNPETINAETIKESRTKGRMDIINEMFKKVQISQNGFVACLNAPTGVGKSHIIKQFKTLAEEDNSKIWLMGQCSLSSKNSPLYFFKDMLKNFFDIPVFNIDIENTKNRVFSFLKEKLDIQDENFINALFAILFYDEQNMQKPLIQNKQTTYNTIATLLRNILGKGELVLQIEDIENIDAFSLEILRTLFNDGILNCNLKIFITSNIDTDIINFFASPHLNKNNTFFAQYPNMQKNEIDDFIVSALGIREELGSNILNNIYEHSNGLPAYIDEFLWLLLQLGIVQITNDNDKPVVVSENASKISYPETVEGVIQLRLTNMSGTNPEAFKALYYASILGFKFLPAVLQHIMQIDNDKLTEIIKFLSMNMYIEPFDTYNYIFKNRIVWENVRNLNVSTENKYNSTTTTINTLVQLTMPDMATVIHCLSDVNIPSYEMISYIELATKEAYTVGDDYAYIALKTQLLEAVELSTIENKQSVAIDIKEELLKLTYQTFPDTAIKYASDLLSFYDAVDVAKVIDVLGLLSISFEITGNYLAVVECVNKAIEKIDINNNKLAGMLLIYSKLNSVLQLGRYEEVINLIKNDVLPVIEQYKNGKISENTSLSNGDISSIEFETKYMYAMALALQGSPSALQAAQDLYVQANELNLNEYLLKAQFVVAVTNLMQGNMSEVEKILTATQEIVPNTTNSSLNTLIWLLIKNSALFFQGEYSKIKNELVMLCNFCINANKYAFEPVVKGFLVKIGLFDGHTDDAQNLAYDEYYKCANNQWALGALMNWYMYCEISIFKEHYDDALKVAQNALDAAEKATINNLFFSSLFKLKIAEIYSRRNDIEMAKINMSEAMQLAEANNYNLIKAKAGIVYYDILLKQIQNVPATKNENIRLLYKHLFAAQEAVNVLKNANLSVQIKKNIADIEEFARTNNIKLDLY